MFRDAWDNSQTIDLLIKYNFFHSNCTFTNRPINADMVERFSVTSTKGNCVGVCPSLWMNWSLPSMNMWLITTSIPNHLSGLKVLAAYFKVIRASSPLSSKQNATMH